VVEDNDEMRTYLRDELGDYWHIRETADGEEGWAAIRDEAPDLVLSDVMMPGPSGYELCEKIKADPDLRDTPQRIKNHLAARRHLRDQYRRKVRVEPLDTVVDEQHISFLETVIETVEDNLADPEFSVDRLAEAAALSRRQLTRRMKETFDATPAAYIRARRIEQAEELLTDGPETIAGVAAAVGFASPSAFSKAFREATGCSPSTSAERHAG
jgi:AraC-like DNA-binding protein